jgi:hypothetical protein
MIPPDSTLQADFTAHFLIGTVMSEPFRMHCNVSMQKCWFTVLVEKIHKIKMH